MSFNLLKNFPLKLISLLIAIFLWYMVTSKDYRYGDFTVPIELQGLHDNLILTEATYEGNQIKNTTVRVRATEPLIRTLYEHSMFVQMDISQLGVGHHLLQLTGEMVKGRPQGVEITGLTPNVIELEIEELLIKPAVKVNPEILGKPAENFDIWQIRCIPSSVRVQGPKSIVEGIESISTPQINIDRLSQSTIERSLLLVPPHPTVNLSPEMVNLRIKIGEKFISKLFKNIPVEINGALYVSQINPKTVSVTVQGPVSQIENLSKDNLRAFVTVTGEEEHLKNIRMDPQL